VLAPDLLLQVNRSSGTFFLGPSVSPQSLDENAARPAGGQIWTGQVEIVRLILTRVMPRKGPSADL
jgi:hypothetical protein